MSAIKITWCFMLFLIVVMTGDVESFYADEDDASSILIQVDKSLEEAGSIQGSFGQEVEMSLMGETRRFNGRVYYRNPDFLRLEYDEPAGQLLVCDGESFWMVMTDQGGIQVFKTPFTGEIGGFLSHSTIRFLIETYDARIVAEERIRDVLCHKICFLSRNESSPVPVIDLCLWVGKSDFLSRKLSYEDLAGNRVVYHFYGWQKVNSLPDHLFSFTPPPGADIFENVFNP